MVQLTIGFWGWIGIGAFAWTAFSFGLVLVIARAIRAPCAEAQDSNGAPPRTKRRNSGMHNRVPPVQAEPRKVGGEEEHDQQAGSEPRQRTDASQASGRT